MPKNRPEEPNDAQRYEKRLPHRPRTPLSDGGNGEGP